LAGKPQTTVATVKTIAQGRPGVSGKPVVTTLVCFFHFAREAAGASRTRLSLRPLLSEGQMFGQTSDAWRREKAKVCLRTMSSSPRKRGSSIPETLMMESRGRGVLDRPVKPDDDRFDCLKLNRKCATCPEVVRHNGNLYLRRRRNRERLISLLSNDRWKTGGTRALIRRNGDAASRPTLISLSVAAFYRIIARLAVPAPSAQ
jgi:hypothetical protein